MEASIGTFNSSTGDSPRSVVKKLCASCVVISTSCAAKRECAENDIVHIQLTGKRCLLERAECAAQEGEEERRGYSVITGIIYVFMYLDFPMPRLYRSLDRCSDSVVSHVKTSKAPMQSKHLILLRVMHRLHRSRTRCFDGTIAKTGGSMAPVQLRHHTIV